MTANLRASLTILSIGFGIEGIGELYSLLSRGSFKPGASLLFVVPAVVTVAGLLFVWIGRHEWNEIHRARVRHAHLVFGVSLLAGVVAAGTIALLAYLPSLGVPGWAQTLFGGAVGTLVLGTFVTYAVLIFHLVSRPNRAVLLASVVWALVVSALVGETLAANLGSLVGLVQHHTFSSPSFLAPVDTLASYLFVAYFLLLAGYVEAHRTVARGRPAVPEPTAPAPVK